MLCSRKRSCEEAFTFLQESLKNKKFLDENNNVVIPQIGGAEKKEQDCHSSTEQLTKLEDEAAEILGSMGNSRKEVILASGNVFQSVAIKRGKIF